MADPDLNGPLPTAFRGYAREAVDRLLEEIEESYRNLIADRNELRSNHAAMARRLEDVTADLKSYATRERAVADALIEVEQAKASIAARLVAIEAEATHVSKIHTRAQEEARTLMEAARRDAEAIRRRAGLETQSTTHEAIAKPEGESSAEDGNGMPPPPEEPDDHREDVARGKLGSLVRRLHVRSRPPS